MKTRNLLSAVCYFQGMAGARVFALLLALYVLTAAGYLAQGDDETMYRVTRNLATGAGLAIGRETLQLPVLAADNFLPTCPLGLDTTSAVAGTCGSELYSKYAPGQSLLALPLWIAGHWLDALWPQWPQLGPRLALTLLNPLALAATGWLMFQFGLELGYSPRLALAATLSFGLASMGWSYVNNFYPQPATGFFLLLAAFAFYRWQKNPVARWAWWQGAALGAAILMRMTAAITVPGLAVALLLATNTWPKRWSVAWRVGVGVAVAIALSLGYNWLRFGSPFDSGYYEVAWTTPPLLGLYGLLFSPGKSVFLYAPPLLLAAGAWPLFFKKQRELALLIILWWLSYLACYSPYNFWTGGLNWGPRFLLPLLAVSLLPLPAILSDAQSRLAWALFTALFVAGVLIQLPAVVVDHVRYLELRRATGNERFYDQTLYQPAFSPLAWQWSGAVEVFGAYLQADRRAAAAHTIQQMELPAADSDANRVSAQRVLQTEFIRLNLPALWWAHLPLWGVSPGVVAGLALPWLALLGWGAAGVCKICKRDGGNL